ncbi:MAG: bifunctional diguanylate cyclase/phosphodiesterase [Lachnospiraceae bacterium]|nr:bifunctional diguanylate cyclase/phosphodiesterase [Lachnospiraceae bacterium]
MEKNSILIVYDVKHDTYQYPNSLCEHFEASFDGRPLGEILETDGIASGEVVDEFYEKLYEITHAVEPHACFMECWLQNRTEAETWYRIGFVSPNPGEVVSIVMTHMDRELQNSDQYIRMAEYDELTGLLNKKGFCKRVVHILQEDEERAAAGGYAIICFDVVRFKAINEVFGVEQGNRLLKHIANIITEHAFPGDVFGRADADHFIIFTKNTGSAMEEKIEHAMKAVGQYDASIAVACNVGIYVTGPEKISVESMIDRAVMANSGIKGSYARKYNYFTEELRKDMLSEQEIAGMMENSLVQEQFVVYYQPQYNHSTGMLVGAEALVRWKHPERGLISPGVFIPIFENNGFITKLDFYVFTQVCKFLHKCMDEGLHMVPVSINFSRHDIFLEDFVERLEEIRKRYHVEAKYLRVEVTETAAMGTGVHINEVIKKLHVCGYLVEMDDFGSGYSSLNVLKDIELDIIKLDMLFLEQDAKGSRGGTILSAVIRMAKWLGIPVIAEGVETVKQADFLRSIGCDYIQGYLYSRPIPESEYEEKLRCNRVGATVPQMRLIDTLNACDFWDPQSQETLIFSNYVGGAAIFEYSEGRIEILRVNEKYLQEICMNQSEKDLITAEFLNVLDEKNRQIYIDMLERAVVSMDEEECETWRNLTSDCCGEERICVRSTVRMIGKSDTSILFYAMIRNVTSEKKRYAEILDSERRFKAASEQVNIYYWEYTVATKEMRPCFRCMRDLGLPALLTNYPDSAIEMGIFPPEIADEYRDWHRRIAEGEKSLEAIMPLTVGRVPFHVRYTTEFDENGNPIKAYGSAALVVDGGK